MVVAFAAAAGTTTARMPARRRRRSLDWLAAHRRAVAAVAVTAAALATTRIVALAVGAGVVLWLEPTMVASYRRRLAEQAMLEAVHLWLLQLPTVLAAGSGLEQALREVAGLQPDHSPLAVPAERMAATVHLASAPAGVCRARDPADPLTTGSAARAGEGRAVRRLASMSPSFVETPFGLDATAYRSQRCPGRRPRR